MSPAALRADAVLVVDDVPANLAVLLDALAAEARVFVAEDGESCLEQLAHLEPDLILLDLMMPGRDGFATLAAIQAEGAGRELPPVIFMTALDEPEQKRRALDAGAVDYVTKPIYVPEVLARVRCHLGLRRTRRELARRNAELESAVALRLDAEEQLRHSLDRAVLIAAPSGEVVFATRWALNLLARHFPGEGDPALRLPRAFLDRWRAAPLAAGLDFAFPDGGALRARLFRQPEGAPEASDLTTFLLEGGAHELSPARLGGLGLSPREAEVLYWVARGKSNPEIAGILAVSVRTVHKHVENLLRKLGVESRMAAAVLALEHAGLPAPAP